MRRPFLDKARWFSAFLVTFGHALSLLNSAANGNKFINFVADMRGPAVIVFFLLSGYLVGGSVLKNKENFDFRLYFARRFSRIYIVLIPALILTLLIDGFVYLWSPANPIYSAVWQNGAIGDVAIYSHYGFWNAVGSLLSIEPVTGHPLGSAGTLWSLGYEWIFYFVFPAAVVLLRRIPIKHSDFYGVIALVAVCSFFSKISAMFFLIWILGAYSNNFEKFFSKRVQLTKIIKPVSFLMMVLYIIYASYFDHHLTLLFSALFGTLFLSTGQLYEQRFCSRYDHNLADFSYSLYVVHLPFMCLFSVALWKWKVLSVSGIQNAFTVVILSVAYTVISYVLAYGFSILFERQTNRLYLYIRDKFILSRTAT